MTQLRTTGKPPTAKAKVHLGPNLKFHIKYFIILFFVLFIQDFRTVHFVKFPKNGKNVRRKTKGVRLTRKKLGIIKQKDEKQKIKPKIK